jgi:hypothetical protein
LEDVRVYRAFERALIGSVDPRSALELALTHRLASLLWRLRRASAIETGLFEIQGELLSARGQAPSREPSQPGTLATPTLANGHSKGPGSNGRDHPPMSDHDNSLSTTMRAVPGRLSKSRTIAQCFLRLSNLDPTLLDRAGSYEERLWRQSAQTLWTLDAIETAAIGSGEAAVAQAHGAIVLECRALADEMNRCRGFLRFLPEPCPS